MGGGAEEYTIGIDQQDITVGAKATEDLRWVLIKNTVECGGIDRGLIELNQFILVDIKVRPINGDVSRLLIDNSRGCIRAADICRASNYLLSCGACE
jgi:hypothetical protein